MLVVNNKAFEIRIKEIILVPYRHFCFRQIYFLLQDFFSLFNSINVLKIKVSCAIALQLITCNKIRHELTVQPNKNSIQFEVFVILKLKKELNLSLQAFSFGYISDVKTIFNLHNNA